MLITALTGGIATGKSVVAAVLAELGCYVDKADQTAHELMKPGTPIWEEVVSRFGEGILDKNQEIHRKVLSDKIFSNPADRDFLNALIHPAVMEKKKLTISNLEKKGRFRIFVSEAALTIEAGFASFFDKIIVTHCRREEQIRRLARRDGISRSQAVRIIRAQMPQKEKIKYADYLIDTSGSIEETIEQSEKVFRFLDRDYEAMK